MPSLPFFVVDKMCIFEVAKSSSLLIIYFERVINRDPRFGSSVKCSTDVVVGKISNPSVL